MNIGRKHQSISVFLHQNRFVSSLEIDADDSMLGLEPIRIGDSLGDRGQVSIINKFLLSPRNLGFSIASIISIIDTVFDFPSS